MSEEKLLEIKKVVKKAFIRIGIKCDMLGYKYLCQCSEEIIFHPELIENLCNGLYKVIAAKNGVERSNNIERAMRTAIELCYDTTGFLELNRMFNMNLFTINDKPTAGELIKLVSEYYCLDLWKEN